MAAQSIANIVKSSLGPLGLDKMLVDNIGVRLPHFALITCREMLIVLESPPRKLRSQMMVQPFSPF